MKKNYYLTAREAKARQTYRDIKEGRMTTARKIEEVIGAILFVAFFGLVLFI